MDRPGAWQERKSQKKVDKMGDGDKWLQSHLWCPTDPPAEGLDDGDDDDDDAD